VLIELSGPLFMSYPALNHIEEKIDQISGGAKVTLRHPAIGMIDLEDRAGLTEGWRAMLEGIRSDFAGAAAGTSK
jgi:hypothetical protein